MRASWPSGIFAEPELLGLLLRDALGEGGALGIEGALDPALDEVLGDGAGAGAGGGLLGAAVVEGCCANTADENSKIAAITQLECRIATSYAHSLGKLAGNSYAISMSPSCKWISFMNNPVSKFLCSLDVQIFAPVAAVASESVNKGLGKEKCCKSGGISGNFGGIGANLRPLGARRMKTVSQCREQTGRV